MARRVDDRSDRLDAYLADRDLAAVWFARPASFAWLTGGDNVITASAPVGIAAAGYDGELRVVTDSIEGERLRAEEVPDGVDVETVSWHEGSLASAVETASPEPAAADFDVPEFASVDATELRQPLTADDVEAYRALGRDAATAVEAACEAASPTDTEADLATAVRSRLAAADARAPVLLVGGERRAQRYRHFTPTAAALDGYALVSVTAESHGLHASLTRTVAVDPPAWFDERVDAARRVETAALRATQSVGTRGGSAGDVFTAIKDAYAAVGVEGEWRHHHQGGAAGFAGREWIATPRADHAVVLPMGYAWNPTVQGTKSENTWLVTEAGVEPLTGGDWGHRSVEPPQGVDREIAAEPLEHPVSVLDRR